VALAVHGEEIVAVPVVSRPQEAHTREGDKVRFCVADVFLPSAEEVFGPLPTDTQLDGVVVSFSDSGDNLRVYAVVDVVRRQTVVVPVNRLTTLSQTGVENG
jgi:hypothetical protein